VIGCLIALSIGLEITNFKPDATIPISVAIVRGKTDAKKIWVGIEGETETELPVLEGKFSIPLHLKLGKNFVKVRDEDRVLLQAINYKPENSDYKVRPVYLLAKDEEPTFLGLGRNDESEVRARFSTAVELMQGFCAQAMADAGYGFKTFHLDFEPSGQAEIDFVRMGETGDDLNKLGGYELYAKVNEMLSKKYDYNRTKVIAIMGFTRYDMKTRTVSAHTALGGGGLGLFASGSMQFWPRSIADSWRVFGDPTPVDPYQTFDDSGLRYRVWANAATTIGAMMHEMGHTFGLPHTVDGRCIMSRGFDQFNLSLFEIEPARTGGLAKGIGSYWDPVHAARLNLQPWLQPNAKFLSPNPPRAVRNEDEITISFPNGIGLVSVWEDGKKNWFEIPKSNPATYKVAELRGKIDAKEGNLVVMGKDGGEISVNLK
jgi:hypothetical protein